MTDDHVNQELEVVKALMEGKTPDFSKCNMHRHAILEKNKFDAHQFVADEIGLPRKGAKGINFGIIYGMGKKKLSRNLGWSADQGRKYMSDYNRRLPEIEITQAKIKQALKTRGYVFDPFGRRYYLPLNRAYVGLNRLIQGWAATAFKVGFVRTCEMFSSPGFGGTDVHPITGRRMPEDAKVLKCIHDELMNEVKEYLDTPMTDWAIRTCMTAIYGLNVPLASSSERANTDSSWDDTYEVTAME
jgi:DNA polymerase-1